MKLYVQQSIQIGMIKIGGMSNSSVFQIGTAGQINPNSYLYNTGGFVEQAPEAIKNGGTIGGPQPGFGATEQLVPISPTS